MEINRLMKTLERHEGFRSEPYRCSAGKLTIGIGRNLEDKGISYAESRYLLKNDLDECRRDLEKIFHPRFNNYPDHIQEVLMNMRFQLGLNGFRSFKKFIAAIWGWDFAKAQAEGLDSKWARHDAPERAAELMDVLRHGWPDNR